MHLSRRLSPPTPSRREGSGEPLLLLHPFTTNHLVWRRMVDNLSADHEVLAVTMPGHWGGTAIRTRDTTIEAFVDFVEAAMDEAGWETCHIAGNSLGGWVALELARRGRARSVTAIAPAGGWEHNSLRGYVLGLKFVGLGQLRSVGRLAGDLPARFAPTRNILLRLMAGDPHAVPMTDAVSMFQASTHCSAYYGVLLAGLRHGPFDGYDEVKAPVRLVLCENDAIIPPEKFGTLFAENLPDVEVTLVPGVGHVPMLEAPDQMSAIVREHVAAHGLAGLLHAVPAS